MIILVTSFKSDSADINSELMHAVKPRVLSNMNRLLIAPYSRDEVRKALFQIGDMKAPDPDGLHAIFFKRFGISLEMSLLMRFLMQLITRTSQLDGIKRTLF